MYSLELTKEDVRSLTLYGRRVPKPRGRTPSPFAGALARSAPSDTGTLDRQLISLPPLSALLVLHPRVDRSLAATAYNQRREECQLGGGVAWYRLAAVESGQASRLGELMSASHRSLRIDYEVSTHPLDSLVRLLQNHSSVIGGKLTGPGFGGACVALCYADAEQSVARTGLEQYARLGGTGYLLAPLADLCE